MPPIIDDAPQTKQSPTRRIRPRTMMIALLLGVPLVIGGVLAVILFTPNPLNEPLRERVRDVIYRDAVIHAPMPLGTDRPAQLPDAFTLGRRLLVPNTPTTVRITADSPAHLTYRAPDAQWVRVTTQAADDDFDTVLMVRDETAAVLTYNDDTRIMVDDGQFAWASDASLDGLYLPQAGDYTLVVDSFNGATAGDVVVTLRVIDPFNVQIVADDGNRQTWQITLPPSTPYTMPLAVVADTTLVITARDASNTLDPWLVLQSADGAVLASSDDHGSDTSGLNTLDAELRYSSASDDTVTLVLRDALGRGGVVTLMMDGVLPD